MAPERKPRPHLARTVPAFPETGAEKGGMQLSERMLRKSLRRGATLLAATAVLALGWSGPARAFTYATGDLVGILVQNNTELIVNLGTLSGPETFSMPVQWGGTLSTGKFVMLTVPNNTDPLGIVTFTAPLTTNVPGFDSPAGRMAAPIAGAYFTLDQPSNDKWLNRLNSVGSPDGVFVFSNSADELVVSGAFANGYTQKLGASTDKINQTMPFSTALKFNGNPAATGFVWEAQIDSGTLAGDFTNLGSVVASDNGDGTVTIHPLPEPGSELAMGSGLVALGVIGWRKRRAA
ncbi:MAG TPA: hypothetical protein VMS55_02415 [Myxococcota bacterium]|nr:hypothetical protein [Myxococcota bacterium]